MTTLESHLVLVMTAVVLIGCGPRRHAAAPVQPLPPMLIGNFTDDYRINYSISAAEWFQRPDARYHITRVDTAAGFLLARNDEANPGERGRWTRIDWVRLSGMAPYEWAFCLSAYDAPSADSAERVTIARKDTPRTGCNGHPFTRMGRNPR